jgi:hypothetical protein
MTVARTAGEDWYVEVDAPAPRTVPTVFGAGAAPDRPAGTGNLNAFTACAARTSEPGGGEHAESRHSGDRHPVGPE